MECVLHLGEMEAVSGRDARYGERAHVYIEDNLQTIFLSFKSDQST